MNKTLTRKDTGWPVFVADVLAYTGWDNTILAARGDFDRSMVGRWLSGEVHPTIESIRKVCRAARVDIREGLIAAGYFTEDELSYHSDRGQIDFSAISDELLITELRMRMRRHRRHEEPALDVDTSVTTEQSGLSGYVVRADRGATPCPPGQPCDA